MKKRKKKNSSTIHIGCSGWNYNHWRGLFYPVKSSSASWFKEYSAVFSTVEINNTFYQLPNASVFKNWRKQAPQGFIYAVKANRYITHMKKLKNVKKPLKNFMERIKLLGDQLGPILFQLPPYWGANAERLDEFAGILPSGYQYVFEFRDSSWYCDEIREILSSKKMSVCLHDMKGSESPLKVVGDMCYIRFHGTSEKYGGGYSAALLRKWIRIVRESVDQGKDVYVYFNNDSEGHAPKDALRLIKALS